MQRYAKNINVAVLLLFLLFFGLYFLDKFLIENFIINKEIIVDDKVVDATQVSIGVKAPDFQLNSFKGFRIGLSDLAKNGTVLTFWSTHNSGSIDQIKILDDFLTKNFSNKKTQPQFNIIMIDSQEPEDVFLNFMRRSAYDVTILYDPTGEITNKYNVRTLPTTFFINKDGFIVDIFNGTLSEKMLVDKLELIIN